MKGVSANGDEDLQNEKQTCVGLYKRHTFLASIVQLVHYFIHHVTRMLEINDNSLCKMFTKRFFKGI